MRIIVLLLVSLIFISGCVQNQINNNEMSVAEQACESICIDKLNASIDLSNGPCLSDNNSNWIITDWVCDVAHSPRQTVDNLAENQCQAFRNGQAHHFIEVDTNCNLIRAV
jgi:hypothetical protein